MLEMAVTTTIREKFPFQAAPDVLAALRQIAESQGCQFQAVLDDALYWPIYNLHLKNPHAKAGLEHAEPKDLIASMRSHEAVVMRLLAEIESLMAVVQA
jgi:type I restriction enzyme M protein